MSSRLPVEYVDLTGVSSSESEESRGDWDDEVGTWHHWMVVAHVTHTLPAVSCSTSVYMQAYIDPLTGTSSLLHLDQAQEYVSSCYFMAVRDINVAGCWL